MSIGNQSKVILFDSKGNPVTVTLTDGVYALEVTDPNTKLLSELLEEVRGINESLDIIKEQL